MNLFSLDVLTYFLIGLPLIAGVFFIQPNRWHGWRWPLVAVCGVWFFATVYLFFPNQVLGEDSFWNRTPWKQLIIYGVMALGMVASVLNDAIKERKKKLAKGGSPRIKLKLDNWDIVQPLLVSFLTFGFLFGQIGSVALSVANLTVSFQTGFFWHVIIGNRRSKEGA
jgi:MFS family permease